MSNKSPNAKLSYKLVKTAIDGVRHAREDIKNDGRVRYFEAHIKLYEIELQLENILSLLAALEYNKD